MRLRSAVALLGVLITTFVYAFAPLSGVRASKPPASPPLASQPERGAAVRRKLDEQLAEITAMVEAQEHLVFELERIAPLVPPGYRMMVIQAAEANGLDPKDLAAVGWVESRWDCTLRGAAGEIGCMQIMPSTAAWVAKRIGLSEFDLASPATNVAIGASYLKYLVETEGSFERALAAYNGGPGATERKPVSSRSYVDRVRVAQVKGR